MGALHEGHIDLIRRGKEMHEVVVCSIFVNPLQFNNAEDLARYPHQPGEDREMLAEVGCDLLFTPTKDGLFKGFLPLEYDLGGLDSYWEGTSRPGHFQGVVNVVHRLFSFVRPDSALFGEKDRQQLAIIGHMARQEHWPERIVPCPTVRASDGLALSSRNMRLSEQEREHATKLFAALRLASSLAFQIPVPELCATVCAYLRPEFGDELDYFGVADSVELQPLQDWGNLDEAVALVAAQVGPVRLIDNLTLRRPKAPSASGI